MDKELFQLLGEKSRQAFGIDGTAGDAQDIPHPYVTFPTNGSVEPLPYCIACGLTRVARVHHRVRH